MIGKKLAVSVVLGAAMLAAPMSSPARADEKEDMKALLERLEKVVKDLKSHETSISTNNDQVRLLKEELAALKNRIDYLTDDIKNLKSRLDAPSSTSKREATPTPATAKLRLVNDYIWEMSVRVNDRSYRLMPGEDMTISVPSGGFMYQILQLQRFPQERTIAPGETKTIRVVVQP